MVWKLHKKEWSACMRFMVLRFVLLISALFSVVLSAVEPKLATGGDSTFYLAADGTLWSWGENGNGQLGHGDTAAHAKPKQVAALTDVIDVSVGRTHTLALRADGRVFAWGSNANGRIGNSSISGNQLTPFDVGLSECIAISAGRDHSLALVRGGFVNAWGSDLYGQCGNGVAVGNVTAPAVISGSLNFRAIEAGFYHSLFQATSGELYACGRDAEGQLGNDSSFLNQNAPVAVSGGYSDIISFSAGGYHSAFVRATAQVYTFGADDFGQLGNGSGGALDGNRALPVLLTIQARKVMAGENHTMAIWPGGYIYVWGDNQYGQCRSNPAVNATYPLYLGLGYLYPRPDSIDMNNSNHTPIVESDGSLALWGNNNASQMGNAGSGFTYSTTSVSAQWSLDVIVKVAAGNSHSLALKADGTVWAWGSDFYGQLGNDALLDNKYTPVQVSGLTGILDIAAGGYHSLAIDKSGFIVAWGRDTEGQLGDGGTSTNQALPVATSGSVRMLSIAAGSWHSLAVPAFQSSPSYYAWGYDFNNQLGNGPGTASLEVPTSIGASSSIWKVSGGRSHSLFLTHSSNVLSVGYNFEGQLGDGSAVNADIPVAVNYASSPDGYINIAAGSAHSIAGRYSGSTMTWGRDTYGQQGDGGGFTQKISPTFTTAPYKTKQVSAGPNVSDWSMLLTADGLVYTAGRDNVGQLGDGVLIIDQPSLVQVSGLTRIIDIAAGDYHGLALAANGQLYSWGSDSSGQLGDNSTGGDRSTPVEVQKEWLPKITLTVTDSAADEESNTATVRIDRTNVNGGKIAVSLSYAGTAVFGSGADHLSATSVNLSSNVASTTFTIVGLPDDDDEDSETIIASIATSPTGAYIVGSPSVGVITLLDNDESGIDIVNAPTILQTFEVDNNITPHSFDVVLTSRPTNIVTVTLKSSQTSEAQLDTNPTPGNQTAGSLVFTTSNWNVPQTVSVYGQQDSFADGNIAYSIYVSKVASPDSKYSSLALGDYIMDWSNVDDDVASIMVDATVPDVLEVEDAGLAAPENTATFTVRLTSQPYDKVVFNLSVDDMSEARISSGFESIILDSSNWLSGVAVQVEGVLDSIDDGDQPFKVLVGVSSSTDAAYDNKGGWNVAGTTLDVDTRGIQLLTSAPGAVTEGGASMVVQYRLATKPIGTADVKVDFSGTEVRVDADPGTVGDQATLTFPAATWNTARSVTIWAIDDGLIETNPHSGALVGTVSAGSGDYSTYSVTVPSFAVNVTDNDAAGFVIAPITTLALPLQTTESGGTANMTVRLSAQPAAGKTVTVHVFSTDPTEGVPNASPATFSTFTTVNSVASPASLQFAGGADLSGIIKGSGVIIQGVGGNDGKSAVVLAADNTTKIVTLQMVGGVSLVPASGEEASFAGPKTIVFDETTWNTNVPVLITGQNDAFSSADSPYEIRAFIDQSAVTADGNFTNQSFIQYVKNSSANTPGFIVDLIDGSVEVAEATPTVGDTFQVRLAKIPTQSVTVVVTPDNQVAVSPQVLTFTTANYDTAQTITVKAVNDVIDEDDIHGSVLELRAISPSEGSSPSYDGLTEFVIADVTDNDQANVVISPLSGLVTSEAGVSATVSVSLASQPISNVVVVAASLSPDEGNVSGVSPYDLTFDAATPSTPSPLFNLAVSDGVNVSGVAYGSYVEVISGANAGFRGVVALANNISPKYISVYGVDAGVSLSNAAGDIRIWPSVMRTFTAANWYQAQSIVVNGIDDAEDDGDQAYWLFFPTVLSADTRYMTIDPPEALLFNGDNDARGVTINVGDGVGPIEEGNVTADAYTIALNSRPSGMVTLSLSTDGQVQVDSSTQVFDPAIDVGDGVNATAWNRARTIIVTAVDDAFVEGTHSGTISHTVSGGDYGGVAVSSVSATVTEPVGDVAGLTITPSSGYAVDETGASVSLALQLKSQPFSTVVVLLSVDDATEGSVIPSTLTFTPGQYNIDQSVSVTGMNDDEADGSRNFKVRMTLFSGDPVYGNLVVSDLLFTNADDDTSGIVVTVPGGLITDEFGSQDSFPIRLASKPTGPVTITFNNDDPDEVAILTASVTFNAFDWNIDQYVFVSGVNDDLNDDPSTFNFTIRVDDADVVSSDPLYGPGAGHGFNVTGTNYDNDDVGVDVNVPDVLTRENGSVVEFQITLRSEPSDDVTIPLSSSNTDEATVFPASLTFTSANWSVPQTVSVTPVDDSLVDGLIAYFIDVGAISAGTETTGYDGFDPDNVPGLSEDDDEADFILSATSISTDENGSAVDYTIQLLSQPGNDVTMAITGVNLAEGQLTSADFEVGTTTFIFTPGNWSAVRTVTVTGVDDAVDDGDIGYVLSHATLSSDGAFDGLGPQDISVVNYDNDTAGVTVDLLDGTVVVDEAGVTDTYEISLNSQPLGVVTIIVTPDSQIKVNGSSTPITLTFNPAFVDPATDGWNVVHTILVSAVADTFDEADPHAATITHGISGYGSVTVPPVSVTVIDNNPPTEVVNIGLLIVRAGGAVITDAMLSYSDAETTQADLIFDIILSTGQGTLFRDFGLGTQVALGNSATFTMGEIIGGQISYQHSGTANNGDGFAFRVRDVVGNRSDLGIFDISISGFNPPVIAFTGGSPSFIEGSGSKTIDPGISVSDADSNFYNLLTVSIVAPEIDDELFIGTGGLVTSSGNTISYNGTPVGTWSGGIGGVPLIVAFSAGLVGDVQASEILSVLQYQNVSQDPVANTRQIRFVLRDETNTENSLIAAVKDLQVFAVNDDPTIAPLTIITPKNVAIDSLLTVGDVDNYPLTLTVTSAPGKGTLSGALDSSTPVILADALASRAFTYTPITGQEGADSFVIEVEDPDGATASATISVLIVGGASTRPWITSDAPLETEAGSPLSYNVVVDFSGLAIAPIASEVMYSLVGTLPAGVTLGGFTPSGTNATLNITVGAGAVGVIEAGIVVTETANNTTGFQPLTIVIVPAGSLGG